MSDFVTSYNWMLDSEDAPRRYNVVMDNNGAGVVSGINAKSYPDDFARIQAIPQDQRGPAIQEFYLRKFWSPWYQSLASTEVGKRVFDMAVNGGPGTTVRLLQLAIADAGGPFLEIDGAWGPNTVAAANGCTEYNLVTAYKAVRVQHYKDIASKNPALAPYLNAWIARAEK